MAGVELEIPDVLTSVAKVVEAAHSVWIDTAAVDRFARKLARGRTVQRTIQTAGTSRRTETTAAPNCDRQNTDHVQGLSADDDEPLRFHGGREDGAQFVLLTDALNFCFWSDAPWEVEYRGRTWTRTFAMLAGVLRAVEADRTWLTARRWATATATDVAMMFAGRGEIPLADLRREVLNETGDILAGEFDGRFTAAIAQAGQDARALAYLLAQQFPSFRDVAMYADAPVAILKRAQICSADLHRTWTANGFAGLRGMEALTVFADYRIPQLFRHEGVLLIEESLAARIDQGVPIAAGGAEEVELRAATIWIGQLLCERLQVLDMNVPAWELDYDLWIRARAPEITVPHHRTVTHYY